MALLDNLVVFIVGLLIGGLGIYIGAFVTLGRSDYGKAIWTGFIGAIIWAIVGFFLGGIALIGPAITFLAWLAVIKSSYGANWLNALAIAGLGWISVLTILYILALFGIGGFEAIGIPGV